jgi:DNA-binding protein HU-beta
MNKAEMVDAVADQAGIDRKAAAAAIEAIFDAEKGVIARTLRSGEKLSLVGFGSFEAKRRAARTGRNPRDGTEMQIPASTAATFKAGKGLKDALQ